MNTQRKKILTLFGTRPEVIKLAPVVNALESLADVFQTVNVSSSQHTDLLYPIIRSFALRVDHDLRVMQAGQTPTEVCARVLSALDPILAQEQPDMVLVQGDTTTALAGALAGFHRRIPVGHVEAGLRSGHPDSPFPEEMNRRLISRLTTLHFAATRRNQATLLSEGVSPDNCPITGNPVVDALKKMLTNVSIGEGLRQILAATQSLKRIVLTTHRRESFGEVISDNLQVMRRFIERHHDVAVIFPVHPNPAVMGAARDILTGHSRIHLVQPMPYEEFIHLLSQAWLIVSDSGGVQEEAPTLGKPLLILRTNTERPEAMECGVARLVGGDPKHLDKMLEEAYGDTAWVNNVQSVSNPFGEGDGGRRIAAAITEFFYE
jgi:UDP-N-acetylglucosamine 2-epimerase (non-hydrolysing)